MFALDVSEPCLPQYPAVRLRAALLVATRLARRSHSSRNSPQMPRPASIIIFAFSRVRALCGAPGPKRDHQFPSFQPLLYSCLMLHPALLQEFNTQPLIFMRVHALLQKHPGGGVSENRKQHRRGELVYTLGHQSRSCPPHRVKLRRPLAHFPRPPSCSASSA
jgi:hypothetical protein